MALQGKSHWTDGVLRRGYGFLAQSKYYVCRTTIHGYIFAAKLLMDDGEDGGWGISSPRFPLSPAPVHVILRMEMSQQSLTNKFPYKIFSNLMSDTLPRHCSQTKENLLLDFWILK